MRSGDLQYLQIIGVGKKTGEVDPCRIQGAYLLQQLGFPIRCVLGVWAIAGALAATDDDDVAVGALRQDLRQGAHEGVEAPVRFQNPADEGQHLVAGPKLGAVGQRQAGIGIRAATIGVDPFVK